MEGSADLVFTCPPYYDLERYSDDPADLSAMRPADFNAAYRRIIGACARALRPDSFAVFVTGDVRNKRGALRDLRGETIAACQDAGMAYHAGAVLLTQVGTVAIRAGRGFTASRLPGRCHQDVTVFCKGSRKRAAARLGKVETFLPDALADD
jgi:hypothetical protein